jgi:NRAMP (natural resistance-associated macrophage protein)-like metal ion transporter
MALLRARRRLRELAGEAWSLPGPGVVTGAADDDPSGIATYSITGARTGYQLLWTSLVTLPLMAAVQGMCARIGAVTGTGLAAVLKRHYPRPVLTVIVVLLVFANIVNIGADIAALASAGNLLVGLPSASLAVPVAIGIVIMEIVAPYPVIANYLKVLTLALFAYIVAAFFAHPDWGAALGHTLLPRFALTGATLTTLVALLGTTISPYLFFWQASQEVEEEEQEGRSPAKGGPEASEQELRHVQLDIDAGAVLANVVFYFIVLTTAATLYTAGTHDITDARQAAEALRPLAGNAASTLFALGLIGTGLLAVPVLAGSAAYAIAEVFGWREGLSQRPGTAPQFYAVMAIATLLGLAMELTGLGAMRALFLAAVVNGVTAPVLIVAITVVCNDRKIMGEHVNSPLTNALGWATVALMGSAAAGLLLTGVRV